ncbi:MAG: hypothetical protein JST43_02840 [Bacteroidetes bacterium]|nr:hypothetical protein [Bacteroidota bacterium]MBS1540336.1 hypothetical protein [Bacteroidota bacterium]
MITSKPQKATITSFMFFLLITGVVIAMNLLVIWRQQLVAWYNYAVVVVLLPIGLFVFYKIFVRYKILKLGNNQIEIIYPFLKKRKSYSLAQLDQWVENKVKTGKNSEYRELQIKFTDGHKISIGHKEHTEYPHMVQYLSQKAPKKKIALS